jgi:hypothetical protein
VDEFLIGKMKISGVGGPTFGSRDFGASRARKGGLTLGEEAVKPGCSTESPPYSTRPVKGNFR